MRRRCRGLEFGGGIRFVTFYEYFDKQGEIIKLTLQSSNNTILTCSRIRIVHASPDTARRPNRAGDQRVLIQTKRETSIVVESEVCEVGGWKGEVAASSFVEGGGLVGYEFIAA